MPKASKISLPVRARQSASRLDGSAAPAESAWRRLDRLAALRRAIFEDLPEDAWHGGEDRRAIRFDETRPCGRIWMAVVEHRAGPGRQRIDDADSKRIGPIDGAGVQHHVAGAEPRPMLPHRPPAPSGAMRMQYALSAGSSCRRCKRDKRDRRRRSRRNPGCGALSASRARSAPRKMWKSPLCDSSSKDAPNASADAPQSRAKNSASSKVS